MLIFTGTYTIMIAIYTGLFMDNFYALSGHIRSGTLDMYMTKPLSLQFMVSFRHVNFALPIPNLIAGNYDGRCWPGSVLASSQASIHVAGYIGVILSSTVVTYSVLLLPQILVLLDGEVRFDYRNTRQMLGIEQYADVYISQMAAENGAVRGADPVHHQHAVGLFDRSIGFVPWDMDFCGSCFIAYSGQAVLEAGHQTLCKRQQLAKCPTNK